MKKKIAIVVFIILIVISIIGLYKYYVFNKNYASSNAVFVKSDSLTFLSFKLPGKIEKIYVNEGDNVKKGELLAKLDTKNLEIQKKELEFNINALAKNIEALSLQKEKLKKDINTNLKINAIELAKLQDTIKAKAFGIDAKIYKRNKLKNDYLRFERLFKENKISREKYETIKTAFLALKDEINADKSMLDSLIKNKKLLMQKRELILNSKKEIERLKKTIESSQQKLQALNEKLALINQNIKDSYLYAPFSGKIAKKFANNNEVIGAGMKVLSLVNLNNLYVLDLLEETKMKGIGKGCDVKIHIDALNKDFDGYIEKILPASAATFALVPRDISSGEFTKLAQRFYVRIRFKKIPKNVLVGMSGEVVIKKCKMEN
ncbi:biotin/lipoyl-binding protein [Caminibacter mediatlanticus TB-2]|uniref:Biotin/lipoyl-binding protein n=1 Tax=Caminibacter mediatlanticus TB-2 TaxID=391592 RepID=A0AAI9F1Q1_9BACT|nr:efflux RND transporter periplasmic adaptor subunit [Caminibacter mediatlanticus]EDM22984.1 hypothetical protein CMTB2_04277 [Caminibacter mediatlanticus TB-2]QCT93971.1 biotin/lipoyl-binding protein [Caminibacter mediatlanticus TB-2]